MQRKTQKRNKSKVTIAIKTIVIVDVVFEFNERRKNFFFICFSFHERDILNNIRQIERALTVFISIDTTRISVHY